MSQINFLAVPVSTKCAVSGCKSKIHGRGFCTKHYQRWRRNGEPILSPPRNKGSWKPTKAQLAYFAGFIDGEGTIGLKREQRRLVNGNFLYTPYISIGNTDPQVLELIYSIFGGNLRKRDVGKSIVSVNAKPFLFVWGIGAKASVAVAELIYPYLIIKKRQAEILISVFGDKRWRGCTKGYPPEYWQKLESTYQEMKELNRRGIKKEVGL